VRVMRDKIAVIFFLAGCLFGARAVSARQDTAILMPEQSTAKAKELIQQAISAMGGSAYLNVRDFTCTGRAGQFGHSGELNGYEQFVNYVEPPTMQRTENLPKRNIVEVYNGDMGWTLDRGGVSEAPITDLARFQENVKRDTFNILRNRIHEDGVILRYGGPDIVNLHEVEWVELVDADDRTIRFAMERTTHLPLEKVVQTRDPKTRDVTEEIELYSNYHPVDGIQTPFQIERDRNGLKTLQVFFDSCQYNTGLPASLFTKESLDDRWAKIGKGEREKEKKQQKKDEKYSSTAPTN
jgi:outer membrane lipoprotein-sorting protein